MSETSNRTQVPARGLRYFGLRMCRYYSLRP